MNSNLVSPRTDPKKRLTSSQIRPKQIGTPTSARRALSVPPSKCSLCEKRAFKPDEFAYFNALVHKSLYAKYASSQNYYYTKDINEMLADSHTPAVIKFKDLQCYDEDDEYLKRMYKASEYNNKIQLLTEYYKFHWDIPRMFMLPTTEVLNRFHDKKRRLQYIRVTNMLKEQKEAKNPQSKAQESLKSKPEESKPTTITDRVLVDLETSYSILKTEDIKGYPKKQKQDGDKKGRKVLEGENIQEVVKKDIKRGNSKEVTGNKVRDDGNAQKKIQKKKEAEEQPKGREISGSHTLQDLNLKLGEIISNSETTNLFEHTEQSFNQSVTNLKSFLSYLKSNPATAPTVTAPAGATVIKENPRVSTTRPDMTKKSLSLKPSTPRQEKKEEESSQQAPSTSRASIITWNRRDSVPLVRPSPSNLTRRDSKATNEPSKGEEKPKGEKEGEAAPVNILGSARILSAQSSLSSTTSKSKSVYPSVTKIRNFEEAVKISQQQSTQQKLNAPADASSAKHASLQPTLSLNIARTERPVKETVEAPPKGIDLSIKIPQFQFDPKEFNFQSAPGSQVVSPKASKSTTNKLTKSTLPLSSRNMEGLALKNLEGISPLTQSPHFRIKSHRESSFDKGQKDNTNTQVSPGATKQIPLIQMALSKNGHARFASGGMVPQGGRTAHGKVTGSPTLTPQTGRDLKGLVPLGNLEFGAKDIRTIPHSASRREMLMKGEPKLEVVSGFALKAMEGLVTDREKELTPLTPKMAVTHREKLISHKHTRSEGGKLKAEQLEALMGTINDQKIRELLRLSDGGPTGLSDLINKSRKSGDSKNGTPYSGSNLILTSHRDGNYDSAPISRKQSQQKNPGDNVITPRGVKIEVASKQRGQIKRMDSVGSESKQKSTIVLESKDELKQGKAKMKFFG